MALDFDGVNDTVSHGNVSTIPGAAALTVVFWVNPDATAVRTYLMEIDAAATISIRFDNAIGGNPMMTVGANYGFVTVSPVVNSVDQHLGFVFDGSGAANADRLKIYVDSALQSLTYSGTIGATIPAGSGALKVSQPITSFYDGRLSHIKVWLAALSADDINKEMFSYTPVRTQNLVLWAPYDDTAATDYSGNGHTGTVTEATAVTGPAQVNYGIRVLTSSRSRLGARRDGIVPIRKLGPMVPLYSRGV